jgi:hypothetical protein
VQRKVWDRTIAGAAIAPPRRRVLRDDMRVACGETIVNKPHPIHSLQEALAARRLQAVEALAAKEDEISADDPRQLAVLQTALVAVREEIEAHRVQLGWGSEAELN